MSSRPSKLRRRLIIIPIVALALFYPGSYVAMSASGDWTFSQTGRLRYSFGLSVSDVVRWQPAVVHWEPFHNTYGAETSRGNFPGYVYSPLIRLDRKYFHPDRPIFPEGE